jgi:aconitate hydratase
MAPEYGATCGIFPVDRVALGYLEFTGRPKERVALAEAYFKEQGLFHTPESPEAEYSDTLELDLATVEASLAGPRRPQDRITLSQVPSSFRAALDQLVKPGGSAEKRNSLKQVSRWESEGGEEEEVAVAEPRVEDGRVHTVYEGQEFSLGHGSVVIAAITSCTNTSNPSVMVAAGLVARNAVAKGLNVKPWVKTSLAPGSKVVTDYLADSGLIHDLEALRFHLVGYGCTTCIGNSGPLPTPIADAVHAGNLVCASVLSGNRNFEGRISPDVRANYLASPPLVVAYALAGRIDHDLYNEPLGTDQDGEPVFLKDIWPSRDEVRQVVERSVRSEMFSTQYADVYTGDETWRALPVPEGDTYAWADDSTYVKHPPYFEGMGREPDAPKDLSGARVLALLGDSITTDHISPAGAIKADSPAGRYLQERGVPPREFNSYGSRRGNHEVMMRGTFANVRLRNLLTPEIEGGFTLHIPSGEPMTIFDAAMKYRDQGVPLVILAGKEYGTGSSRDWAAKGPALLGVKAVIAASYERIHRSNLVGMGVAPLEFVDGQTFESLGLSGRESYAIEGLAAGVESGFEGGREVTVRATDEESGESTEFQARVRLDTPQEVAYYRHGGILQYVLRQLLAA